MTWLLLTACIAAAAVDAEPPHARARLVSQSATLPASGVASVGVLFDMDPGWHIYWQNPGDSGEAPRVRWQLPGGVTADPWAWPVPRRLVQDPLVNYGYEDTVLFTVPLHTAQLAAPVTLRADVSWLVCREVCIPGRATLALALPVGPAAPSQDANIIALFSATRAAVPGPAPNALQLTAHADATTLTLKFAAPAAGPWQAYFFARVGNQIEHAAPQMLHVDDTHARLTLTRSDQLLQLPTALQGVLQLSQPAGSAAYDIDVPIGDGATPLGRMLLLALLGGLLLNIMPCVFPVLSIKVLALVRMGAAAQRQMRVHALLYTLGILASAWSLAGLLLLLRHGGAQLGWGFQLQSPAFVLVLAALLFALGLNMLGIFEIGGSLMGVGQNLAGQEGATGAFFTGVLATVVATPCSAPFMGTAIGFALTQPAAASMLIFTALGLGLALPYMVIAWLPGLARRLPRPGAWLEVVKQAMAFPLLGTVVWLAWVLGLEAGPAAMTRLLAALLAVGLAAWVLHRWPSSRFATVCALIIAGGSMVATAANIQPETSVPDSSDGAENLSWEPFSPAAVATHRQRGERVFVDFTAAWCVSCKVNELLVFGSPAVRTRLRELDVKLLKGDWTHQDAQITQTLTSFGRSGVPMYLLYGKGEATAPVLLPEIITPTIVMDALNALP